MRTHSNLSLAAKSVRSFLTFVALGFLTLALHPVISRAQGTLTNGYTHQAVIAPIGNVDTWTFSATAGDRLWIRVGKISQTNTFSPRITLLNPGLAQIATADGISDAAIYITATNTGTFTVNVDDLGSDATGTYRLTLAKSSGTITVAPGDEGGPLTSGWTYAGVIDAGDLDAWNFTASNGDSLVIRLGSTNILYPQLLFYGPDGALLADSAIFGVGQYGCEVAFRATNSGTFTVAAGSAYPGNGISGSYLLTLAKSPGTILVAPGDEGGTLTNGWTHQGTINSGDLDVWNFTATSGDNMVVRFGSTNTLWPQLLFYGPDGALLTGAGIQAQYGCEVAFRATNSGTFTVVAGSAYPGNGYSGSYVLTLAKTPGTILVAPGDEGGTLTNGWTHQGTINSGDLDAWNFTATSGDNMVVRFGSTNTLWPQLLFYGPDGALLTGAGIQAQYGCEVAFRATNSGTFTVVAGSAYPGNGYSGSYVLTLAKTPGTILVAPGDEGGTLTNGWTHQGTINSGDLDAWNFTATSGDNMVVRFGSTNTLWPQLLFYGPDGALLTGAGIQAQYGCEVAFRATNSGTFTVVAGSAYPGNGYSGSYVLTLAKTPGTILVAPGDEGGTLTNSYTHLGTITRGDLDVFTFVACDGDGFILQANETADNGNFQPALRLYAPDGTLLNTSSGTASAQINRTAPSLGTYTLVIGDGNVSESGTYQLTGLGISRGFILCRPVISNTNVIVRSAGGTAGSNYVLFTATNIALPLTNWTPIRTNQFGAFGEFSVTNLFNAGVTQQYFRARTP